MSSQWIYVFGERSGADLKIHPRRDREEPTEAAYRCRECDRPWIIFAVEGELADGVNPRECRFCGAPDARRTR